MFYNLTENIADITIHLTSHFNASNFLISGQEYKSTFTALNKAINGTSIEDFLTAAENAMQTCSMILKKVDKKKDR